MLRSAHRASPVHGHWASPFEPAVRELSRQLASSPRSGAALCVYRRGEPVVDVFGGVRNGAGEPWRADTLVMAFSTGKGCAATLFHVLVDAGLARYEDRVCDHWPEFAQASKQAITIRQLLSHGAGLHRLSDLVTDFWEILDFDAMAARVAAARPKPGSWPSNYHGISFSWLLGELLRRVGKQPIDVLLKERLCDPLELDGAYFGLPEHEFARCAELLSPSELMTVGHHALGLADPLVRIVSSGRVSLENLRAALVVPASAGVSWNDRRLRRACLLSSTGVFTARSLARIYAALACGGRLAGVTLLSEPTLRALSTVQSHGHDGVMGLAPEWRLGYHGIQVGGRFIPGAFGHCGYRGTGAFADPSRQLSFAFVHNGKAGSHPMGGDRFQRLVRAVLACADGA